MSTKATIETRTVGFSISGEFVTTHCRNLWSEQEYRKAFNVPDCMIGMTKEQQFEILFGEKKLVGVNDLELVDDSWTPPELYLEFLNAFMTSRDIRDVEDYRDQKAWDYAQKHYPASRGNAALHRDLCSYLGKLVGEEKAENFEIMFYTQPESWAQAVAIDEAIRDLSQFGMRDECFVYGGCIPLTELAARGFPRLRKKESSCHSGHCFN